MATKPRGGLNDRFEREAVHRTRRIGLNSGSPPETGSTLIEPQPPVSSPTPGGCFGLPLCWSEQELPS